MEWGAFVLDFFDEKTSRYVRELCAEMRAEIATREGLDRLNSLLTIGMNDAETALRLLRVMPDSTRELYCGAAAIGLQVLRNTLQHSLSTSREELQEAGR